jgi:hypothetical protein
MLVDTSGGFRFLVSRDKVREESEQLIHWTKRRKTVSSYSQTNFI